MPHGPRCAARASSSASDAAPAACVSTPRTAEAAHGRRRAPAQVRDGAALRARLWRHAVPRASSGPPARCGATPVRPGRRAPRPRRKFVYNSARCCGFSPPASRMAAASWSSSMACPPVFPSISTGSPHALRRRQGGYGRGRRMAIESDTRGRAVGRPPRAHDRRAGRAADREPRLGELAADDAHRRRGARRAPPARTARRSSGRVPGTPISPARSSTSTTTSATCSSGPAHARRRRAWRPARLAQQLLEAVGMPRHQPRHGHRRGRARRTATLSVRRGRRRCPPTRRCAASTRTSRRG